jgi:hypothetical protein
VATAVGELHQLERRPLLQTGTPEQNTNTNCIPAAGATLSDSPDIRDVAVVSLTALRLIHRYATLQSTNYMSRSQRDRSLTAVISPFYTGAATLSSE